MELKSERIWEERYEEVRLFYQEHGQLEISDGYVGGRGKRLDHWMRTQRNAAKAGKLSQRQLKLLKEIGMRFERDMVAQKRKQRAGKTVRTTV